MLLPVFWVCLSNTPEYGCINVFVRKTDWKLVSDPILDDERSLVAKMGAFEKAGIKKSQKHPKPTSMEEAASQYDAICKWGWLGISFKEYYASRLMRL